MDWKAKYDDINWKTRNRNAFYRRHAHLEERIDKHFLEGSEAILPCRITEHKKENRLPLLNQ